MLRRSTLKVLKVCIAFMVIMLASAAPISAQQYTRHIVQRGETLQTIAARYSTTWEAIASLNNLSNANRIYAGQVLLIPARQSQPIYAQYTIQYGDTLTTIAQRYSTTVDALVDANSITISTTLRPGMVLNIPGTGPAQPQQPQTPQTPSSPRPAACNTRHTVQYGDTMFRISAWYGVNVYRIAESNGILNLNRIYAGQSLFIPCA